MKSFYLFIFFSAYFISSAQTTVNLNYTGFSGSLSGKVIDSATGNPLPGSTVYIADLKLGVVADASGNYRFANLPIGNLPGGSTCDRPFHADKKCYRFNEICVGF